MTSEQLYTLIGQNIKKVRKKIGISQEQLANDIGMSRGFISQIESPKVKTGISLDTLIKISQKYNIDIKTFFENN